MSENCSQLNYEKNMAKIMYTSLKFHKGHREVMIKPVES